MNRKSLRLPVPQFPSCENKVHPSSSDNPALGLTFPTTGTLATCPSMQEGVRAPWRKQGEKGWASTAL